MVFSNPIALWGLAGLLIPVAIHLLSRKEGRVIRIGSIRHLTESDSRQFKSIRPNELLLFALRSLMIIWIVLLLSGLHVPFGSNNKSTWVLIEKGIEGDAAWKPLRDSLTAAGFEERVLARGFPLLNENTNSDTVDYWTLMEELRQKGVEKTVVISYSRITSFAGRQQTLPENVHWLTASGNTSSFPVFAYPAKGDSVLVRMGTSSSSQTAYTNTRQLATTVAPDITKPPDTLRIAIIAESEFSYDVKILRAALQAIDVLVPEKIVVSQSLSDNDDVRTNKDGVIWLSSKMPRIPNATKVILFQAEPSEHLFSQTSTNQWSLTSRLNEDIALQKNLTLSLSVILFSGTPEKDEVLKNDWRVLDERIIHAEATSEGTPTLATVGSSSNGLWVMLLLITWLGERWIAYKRNQ